MVIKLYDLPASPPCRAVKLTLKALNLDYELHLVDMQNKEHLTEDYIKMNPQHTFPVLTDNDFIIWDSHAINGYLVDVYGKDDSLYPKDHKKRAVINQRLHFECGVLFASIRRIVTKLFQLASKGPTESKLSDLIDENEHSMLKEACEIVEKFLSKGTKYIADDAITIADFSFVTTISTINLLIPGIINDKHPLLIAYLQRCKRDIVGYEEINQRGLTEFKVFFKTVFGIGI